MTDFSLSDWDDVSDLIEQALERPRADRDAWLRESCAADSARLDRARRVLAAVDRAGGFLDMPAADLAADLAAVAADADRADAGGAGPGALDTLGPYRLLRRIGHGGMGDVFLAERADDEFRREVAIKLVRPGLGDDLVARFRHERQVLASLDHPNIAQLYDGGVAPDGRPYLVMEYVDGEPLGVSADGARLTVDDRLRLFLQICDAVDSAHRHLVVHRDLKPTNVLVSRDGTAKLLDFGVAKLLEPEGSSDAPVTRIGTRAMTPEYASPEQFLGEPTSTVSDVYALGVLLYELLTGVRPRELDGRPLAALERDVLEREPDPPSTACRRPSAARPPRARAEARRTTVDGLVRQLRGDLDTIVLTAMRREPARRYASVAALQDDIARYRTGRPVMARPATVAYRASKFVRRHRAVVAAAVLVAVAVVVGTATTLVQARTAAREGRRAEQIRDFLVSVFQLSGPNASRGETVTARELLDQGSARIDQELAGDPALRGEMLQVLGDLYRELGLYVEARRHLEEAVSLRRPASDPLDLVDSLSSLASVLKELDDLDGAEARLTEAHDLAVAVEGRRGPTTVAVVSDLSAVYRAKGEYDTAERLQRDAIAARRAAGDSGPLADSLNALSVLLSENGHAPEAADVATEALTLMRQAYGTDHTRVALAECNLATALQRAGRLDDAIAAFGVCIADRRRLLGDRHPDLAVSLNTVGLLYSSRNEDDEAERRFIEALSIQRAAFGEHHTAVAGTLNNLAILEFQRQHYADAAERFRQLTDVWTALVGPDHPNTLATRNNLGMSLRSAGDLAGAAAVLTGVLEARDRVLGPDHPEAAMSRVNLATVLERQGRFTEARARVREAIPRLERAYPDGHQNLAIAYVALGREALALDDGTDALAAFDKAMAMRARIFGPEHLQTAEARIGRGEALAAVGRIAEGRAEIETALAHLEAAGHHDSLTAQHGRDALSQMARD